MTAFTNRHLRFGVIGAIVAGALAVLPSHASGATRPATAPQGSKCAAVSGGGSGGFLGRFRVACTVASTVPAGGDLNPYGVAVVPRTTGDLRAGDVLVSNFNDEHNLQGTGSTILEISPCGRARVFADLAGETDMRVGLTTALAVFADGVVVVGSLPTADGTARTAGDGALYVLNSHGHLIETIRGSLVKGPWDLASYGRGTSGFLFVTNVLNGTKRANGQIVRAGDIVRIGLDLSVDPPKVVSETVIASRFPERTDPAALVIGPTGVAVAHNGTVYVADTLDNRIAAIRDGLHRVTSDGTARTVTAGHLLDGPLGLALAPNGDLLATNGGNGDAVEVTPRGDQRGWLSLDSSGSPPGAGALFGLAVTRRGSSVYFVDDATNTLDILKHR